MCHVIRVGLEADAEEGQPTPFVEMAYDRATGHIVNRDGDRICIHPELGDPIVAGSPITCLSDESAADGMTAERR